MNEAEELPVCRQSFFDGLEAVYGNIFAVIDREEIIRSVLGLNGYSRSNPGKGRQQENTGQEPEIL
jgi:hypothetical protein